MELRKPIMMEGGLGYEWKLVKEREKKGPAIAMGRTVRWNRTRSSLVGTRPHQ